MVIVGALLSGLFIWRVIMSSPHSIGKAGERHVARKLSWLPKEYIVLNDIMLKTRYGTTQIDHVIVSPYGIFVIETKNYKGWIFGHENSEEWKQSLLGKKRMWGWSSEKHQFRNPIRQNQAHTRAIKRLLSEIGDFRIIPIVVFSDSADLRITAPNHVVVNWSSLRSAIKQFDVPCVPDQYIWSIVGKITSANIVEEKIRENHAYTVQQAQQRKRQMVANGICSQCCSALVERDGKYGRFLGCSNYPRCKFTSPLD
ncbi:MAG: NERD domain-containing protein [Bacteroidales bacterium]|nr:NERD domain-containing protein [Bacteroidales bacterium]